MMSQTLFRYNFTETISWIFMYFFLLQAANLCRELFFSGALVLETIAEASFTLLDVLELLL